MHSQAVFDGWPKPKTRKTSQ